ncbi:MAG: prepilin-type N-terminal cleavage/methylation domain-containing protein [Bacilli bacterium]|nr:prepilin-type N-terminal cleavage/methylation domain-containing protein [Bacilli bacterium]
MKKLNRKGFTLIELLAVIVILAIIVVVTVPTILSSIDDARLSTINSLSKEVATWYDESVVKDEMAFGANYQSVLGGIAANGNWQCLDALTADNKSLAARYGLTSTDIKLDGTAYSGSGDPTSANCSSIKLNSAGHAEVLLVGATGGKFGSKYSFSTAANGKKLAS